MYCQSTTKEQLAINNNNNQRIRKSNGNLKKGKAELKAQNLGLRKHVFKRRHGILYGMLQE